MITVKQLISRLNNMPPDAVIVVNNESSLSILSSVDMDYLGYDGLEYDSTESNNGIECVILNTVSKCEQVNQLISDKLMTTYSEAD